MIFYIALWNKAGKTDIVGAIMDITKRQVAEDAIRRSEAYLAEAQKLSHTGSFGWMVSSGEIFWSDKTFRIFERDPKTKPTLEFALSRVHPDDRELVHSKWAERRVTAEVLVLSIACYSPTVLSSMSE
jgi:PAS domain-containing protein